MMPSRRTLSSPEGALRALRRWCPEAETLKGTIARMQKEGIFDEVARGEMPPEEMVADFASRAIAQLRSERKVKHRGVRRRPERQERQKTVEFVRARELPNSIHYAQQAARTSALRTFRADILKGALIGIDQLHQWAAEASGEEREDEVTEVQIGALREDVVPFVAWPGTGLSELANAARVLMSFLPWTEFQTTTHLLTGFVPRVPAVQVISSDELRVLLSVDPETPGDCVWAEWDSIRKRLLRNVPKRSPDASKKMCLALWGRGRRLGKQRLMQEWNSAVVEAGCLSWQYGSLKAFERALDEAVRFAETPGLPRRKGSAAAERSVLDGIETDYLVDWVLRRPIIHDGREISPLGGASIEG